jgi:type 1 glutamine amidotransferase
VGIHGATECEKNWQWYGNLVGAYLKGHPSIQPGVLTIVDSTFIATKFLPRHWKWTDEWYTYQWMYPDLHILITLDENSYNLEKEEFRIGPGHPVAWYHEYDGGRSFYTALGHNDEALSDPLYLQHILGGIEYAMSKKYMK